MANNMKDTMVEEELLISIVAKLTVIKDNRTAIFQKTVIKINYLDKPGYPTAEKAVVILYYYITIGKRHTLF